jgi:desulfoferrodoxin (superoxide reductase-like protein)
MVLFILFLFLSAPQLLSANAPKSVDLSFDAGAQALTVTIDHYTLSVSMHHVEYVEIKKNGVVISNNKYENQPAKSAFTYTYTIPAAKGDVFEVTAICNLWGRKAATLAVP